MKTSCFFSRITKTLVVSAILTNSLFADFTHRNIRGIWEISSYKTTEVVFGDTHSEYLEVQFMGGGRAQVVTTGEMYFYEIENGNLVISKNRPNRKGKFINQDVIASGGMADNGCLNVKYVDKNIATYWNKSSFQMCKMIDERSYSNMNDRYVDEYYDNNKYSNKNWQESRKRINQYDNY